ncbi:type II toxin-antitoxin system Phd/YefM family antitoxin [Candidatus Poriferisodalis sp.]|uniref:type II toxin-antitoxin system Phd/YefM family antitoxin n=1 Tax=Candidatus Poriferisodalis sp. TaxID=3101277 RepID=UPI003B58BD3F
MAEVGIRALKQNASEVVARVAAGEEITVTNRGRPVAKIIPIRRSRLEEMIAAGEATPARGKLEDLPPPQPGPNLSDAIIAMRAEERY